ncbi:MAG TPA: ABC transporter permease [Dongiaceae bacterium]|nr:ABC transporter permease [Dongiaceae bacterium]
MRRTILLAPGLGYLALLLVVPCLIIFAYSLFERGTYGGIDYTWTLENYQRAASALFARIFLDSARIAGTATLAALLVAYPAAYAIAQQPRSRQMSLLVLVMLPFWSNYLIRTYAWIVLLNNEGLINRVLESIGLIHQPLPLLYNEFAVVLGLVYNYVPFVILALYSSISRLGPELREASFDLGGSAWTTFRRVTLPLTVPGVAAGAVFVFVLSIGNFVTPDLLGGGQRPMLGNLIYSQYLSARDWPMGSALGFILVVIMLALLFAQAVLSARASGETEARQRVEPARALP